MRKLLMILGPLVCVALVFGVARMRGGPDETPQEVEASAGDRAALERMLDAVLTAHNQSRTADLERLFGLSARKRDVIRGMDGEDPVKSSLELLARHGKKLSVTDAEYLAVKDIPSRFYITGSLNGKQRIRLIVNKRDGGYRLLGITEEKD